MIKEGEREMELCFCFDGPAVGQFTIGNCYTWKYIIDGICVFDDTGEWITLQEILFYWYFQKEVVS